MLSARFITALLLSLGSISASAMTKGAFTADLRYAAIRSFGLVRDNKIGQCTGTFISKRHLLTAAHCFEWLEKTPSVRLFVGEFPFSVVKQLSRTNLATSYRVFIHPSFAKSGPIGDGTDAAVIEFDSDVTDDYLPIEGSSILKNERLVTTGYGCDKATKTDYNDFQIGAEFAASIDSRRVYLKKIETIMCPGDSGGPVLRVAADKSVSIVGINSYYNPIGRLLGKSADRAARVDDESSGGVRAWINDITAGRIAATYEVK